MKPLPMSFARADGWRPRPAIFLLFLCALAMVVATGAECVHLLRDVGAMQRTLDSLGPQSGLQSADSVRRIDESRLAPEQLLAVNQAVASLNLPWRDLLDQIDLAETRSVSLVAIEPDPAHDTIHLAAEASGSDGMLDYVASLARQPDFTTVALRKHQVDLLDPYQPLRFTVDVTWHPVTAETVR